MKKLNTKLLANKLKKTFFLLFKQEVFLFVFSLAFISYIYVFAVINVTNETELFNAINSANTTPDTISFQNDITLSSKILPAITNTYTIEGNNYTLDGSSAHRGFIILGSVGPIIQNLTISNTLAKGGDGGNNFQKDGGSGGGGLGAGGAIFVGNFANATLSNITFTTNNATGGSSPDPTLAAAGNSGGGGGGGLGGNGGDSPGTDGGGGGGSIEGEDASGSTGSGTGGTGAQSPSTNATPGGYGGGGGGAANTASTTASAAGGIGGGGGGGAGNLGNANGSTGGFGAGGGGGGADTGIAGGTNFGGGSAQNGATGQGGRGGGGAALGGSIFIGTSSTLTLMSSTYPFTTTNTLTAGAGHNTPTAPVTLGNHIFIASGGTLQIFTSGTFTLTQAIESDSLTSLGGVEVYQGGTVDLSGPSNLTNTFRGNLTIANGTVKYDSVNSLGNGTGIIFPNLGSTKILDNTTPTPSHIYLSNPITANGEGTIQGSGFASSTWRLRITSPITGTFPITIKERRAVMLTVASPSFSGGWIVDGENIAGYGKLFFDNPDTLGTGTIQIKNGAELRHNSNSSGHILANDIQITETATISYRSGRIFTLSGNISDGSSTGNIIFTQFNFSSNTGQCILTGSNTYTGTTTILRGTIQSNIASSISSSSAITLTSPGQLQINNVSQTIKNLSGDGNLILNQGATNTLTVNQTTDLTHSGDISGTGKFEKAGSGNLTFTTAKTYTGETTLTAGTLTFDGGIADIIKTSSSVTINGGTLDILTTSADQQINELSGSGGTIDINNKTLTINNATTAGTFSGVIKNTTPYGNIKKTGSNTLTLSGTNTYSGTTVIDAGTLTLSSTGDISSSISLKLNNSSNFTLASEISPYSKTINDLLDDGSITSIDLNQNTLIINQQSSVGIYNGIISSTGGGGNITKTGSQSLRFTNANTYQGTTTINAGALTLTSSGSITNSSVTINTGGKFSIVSLAGDKTIQTLSGSGGTIDLSNNALTITQGAGGGTYSGVISGSGNTSSISIIKEGTGTLSLNENNTYTGKTLINAGVLDLQASGHIASSQAVTITDPGILFISSGSKTINDLSGTGSLILNNASDTLTLNQTTDPLTISGIIYGSGNLKKSGSANLFLEGANVFTGSTIVSSGTLTIKDSGDISTSSVVTLTGNLEIVTTGSALSKSIKSLSGTGNINLNQNNLTISQQALLAYSGIISGSGNLVIEGNQELQFTATSKHLYSGTTTINSGELNLSTAGSSIEDSSELILAGGTFSITGGNKSIKVLSGTSGEINLKASVLTINQTVDRTYSGIFTDTVSSSGIVKNGANNLTLAGINTFSGTTTINDGSLILNDTGSIGNANVLINSPGIFAIVTTSPTTKTIKSLLTSTGNIQLNNNSLTINQGSVATYSGTISGSGNITKSGSGNLTFDNNQQAYTGSTTISQGTLTLAITNAILSSSEVALTSASSALTINSNQNINTLSGVSSSSISLNTNNLKIFQNSDKTFAGVISGVGSIEKAGSSKLTFTNAQSYTGSTTISAGSLELSQSADISSSSSVQINTSGASLDIASSAGSKTINNLSGVSASFVNLNNNNLTINQSTNQTYSGIITGTSGSITKSNSANLTLGGINTFTGQTTITDGKLIIDDNGSISNSSSLTINSPGIFAIETTNLSTKSIKTLSGSGNIELNTNSLTITQESNTTYSGIISGSGGITKAGSSTLTLNGVSTYTNSTTITNGKLSINPTGAIDFSSNVIITSPGILEANNATSAKTFKNLQGTGSLSFPIDSTIEISLNTSINYSGDIQGSSSNGWITLKGNNVFTLSGNNTFRKMTIQDSSTLSIGSANNLQVQSVELKSGILKATETFTFPASLNISGPSATAIEVLTDKTLTFSSSITSITNVNVSKTGAGTLSITSSNAGNSGTTTIAEGKMLLKPSSRWSSTSFNINFGAKLAGSGTLQAAVTNAGIISPGESIDTLTIDGSYTENGTLEIEITSTPNDSDKINVIGTPGTATLNPSSKLSIIPLSDTEFFKEGTEYVIITATGGVTGTFGSVVDSDPKLIFDVRYEPNRVVLIMSDNLLILPVNAIINPNAKAVAKYLVSCNFTNPDYLNVINSMSSLDLQNLTDALLQISPARFGALQLTNYTNDQTVSKILTDRLRKLYRCNKACKDKKDISCIKPKSFEFWLEPFSYFIHQRDLEKQRPFKNKVFGSMMGSDFNFSNKINFGGAGGYSFADIDWKDNLGYAKIHSIYGSLYASRYNSFGFINASILATANFYKIKRKIHFADVERKAKSKHNGFDITAHLGGGLDFLMADNFYFQPTVDIDYTYVWNDNFKERAADSLNLIVDTSNFSRIKSVTLLNFIKDIKLKNLCLSPSIKMGYSYEDELSNAKITSRLEGVQCTKNKFTIKTFNKNHSRGIVGANITGTKTDGFTFYVNYQFEFGHKFHQHLATARFEWSF